MRIAIVSTGLGHVSRGIEAWAVELTRGFANSKTTGKVEVTLFGAKARGQADGFEYVAISSLRRGDALVRLWSKVAPAFTWRWHWKSGYGIEQKSFAKHLTPYLQRGDYDVVHTQDVTLALDLEKARKKGIINPPTILAHGTDEDIAILSQFKYLQHLSPEHGKNFHQYVETADGRRWMEMGGQDWIVPNFVDTERFSPITNIYHAKGVNQSTNNYRATLGIPSDALVIGCSAALQFHHKRLDYLIKEVSGVECLVSGKDSVFLLLAGASTDETSQVEAFAQELLGDRFKILKNLSFDEMPEFYRALDIYVHPAAEEFFGICFLEAMSCGKPVVAHESSTLQWIVGADSQTTKNKQLTTAPELCGGVCVDMKREGAVREFLEGAISEWMEEHGKQARERVEEMFSWEAVEPRFLEMYENVAGKE